jgi:hypothetical protein
MVTQVFIHSFKDATNGLCFGWPANHRDEVEAVRAERLELEIFLSGLQAHCTELHLEHKVPRSALREVGAIETINAVHSYHTGLQHRFIWISWP